ncbi:MAG: DUF1385 domain-containing protein [Lachnospiraceae bacterium]|nr:DUF1385 domain-containing protein [Lachnospiraceae bacterium]MCD7766639.1 DUF1385 domain-containing protein [Lachnospiraceae bacterium]
MKPSGIGGQAVIEGVMMRNRGRYAVAVRTQDGKIVVDTQDCSSEKLQKHKFVKLPIIRGVVNFFDSMILGMKTLMFSASFFAEETEEERAEREGKARKKAAAKAEKLRAKGKTEAAEKTLEKCEKKLAKEAASGEGSDDDDWLMTLTVIFSLAFSVVLFMMLPYFISRLLNPVIKSETILLMIESAVKLLIFFGYLLLISRMKDIQRTFMYHGAEHKCINCIENGLELTVENVRKCSREHKRCGTSFLFIVMFISIIFIMLFSIPLFALFHVNSSLWRIVLRLALLPLIAGVSYEFIQLAGRTDNKVINALSRPGMMMQHMTTKEPDDSMIEVGIASVEAVFDWRKFENEQFGTHYELKEDAAAEQDHLQTAAEPTDQVAGADA